MSSQEKKVWAGRFANHTDPLMHAFSRSVEIDRELWREDLAVNHAWAEGLFDAGILSVREYENVITALHKIEAEFADGSFVFLEEDEDIHVAIERRLTEICGESGAKIHSGRSRNDQVTTDTRLYLKRKVGQWAAALIALQESILAAADKHRDVIIPGYTHLQQAQPIRLSYYFMALFWNVQRTLSRLDDYGKRLDVLPLGCGALAGSGLKIDRKKLAARLGFKHVAENCLDATGSRDFCSELLFIIAAFFTALSRFGTDLQIWGTQEFGFLEFSDAFATGSSMMPQKKNPDAIELIRGKAAGAIAAVTQLLTLEKGIPATYMRDLQEDKTTTFHYLNEVITTTKIFAGVLCSTHVRESIITQKITEGLLATDLADLLVSKNIPFRKAHEIVGEIVKNALETGQPITELWMKKWCELFGETAEPPESCTLHESVERRAVYGGTSIASLKTQIQSAREIISRYRKIFKID